MKKFWIALVVIVIAAVLFVPVPTGVYKDGGTRVYSALTYKIVDWNRITGSGLYARTRVYFLPDNFRSLDALWDREVEHVGKKLTALVTAATETEAVLESVEDGSRYRVSLPGMGEYVGQLLEVTWSGGLLYSDPPLISNVLSWKPAEDCRSLAYTEVWIDKEQAEPVTDTLTGDYVITKIYADCFFAKSVVGQPYEFKFNGSLSGDWCVGDQVLCTYRNVYYDDAALRMEGDMVAIEVSNFVPDPAAAYKPVLYLYPEERTDISVKLNLAGEMTCAYPRYEGGWRVTADPDGTLTDISGQTYNYLYWEGLLETRWDWSRGFCVKGEDTAEFLEEALEKLGLTRREANEFIVYWLPMMEGNPYNIIAFQTEAYTDGAELEIDPAPDSLIRVFMTWRPSAVFEELEPQELTAPERSGFTVVEWGGDKA